MRYTELIAPANKARYGNALSILQNSPCDGDFSMELTKIGFLKKALNRRRFLANGPLITGALGTSSAAADAKVSEKIFQNRADLKLAASQARDAEVFQLHETNRAGVFQFQQGDFSQQLSVDTVEAIYLAVDGISPSKAALVRQYGGLPLPEWGDTDLSIILPIYEALGLKAVQLHGEYLVSNQIKQGNLHLQGPAKLTQAGNFRSLLHAQGALEKLPRLKSTLSEGIVRIEFARPHGLSVNDLLGIYDPNNGSWHGGRRYYRAGEICEIVRVDENTVTVKRPLVDTYSSQGVVCFLIKAKSPSLSDIEFETTTAVPVEYDICRDIIIDRPKGITLASRQMRISRSYNFVVDSPFMNGLGTGAVTDYCIVVANSQHGRINGGNLYGRRHPISLGGGDYDMSVPCDDIKIIGSTLSNGQMVDCADFHGNVRNSQYINCEIHGSIKFGGKNNGYRSCTVGANGNGVCLNASEILGGRHFAIDCDFATFRDPREAVRGIFDVGGNANGVVDFNSKEDCSFIIRGGSLKARNLSKSTSLLRFYNRGSRKKVNFNISGIIFDVDNPMTVLATNNISGNAMSDYIVVDGLINLPAGSSLAVHAGNSDYINMPHRLQSQRGSDSLTAEQGEHIKSGDPIRFAYRYPRAPIINVDFRLNNGSLVSDHSVLGQADNISAGDTRFLIYCPKGEKWKRKLDVTANWVVGIDEV
ncbi:MAG: hypothetical protein ABJO01_04215 [Parasphingorhabdus sp.]|uniref:phage tailspike polysaccharide lyase family protein n=1 Tax=Parasphingorhabdus sp. TaxID=2709688 RepID=UPI003297D1C6